MSDDPSPCDPSLVESYLNSDESGFDDEDFVRHLVGCVACREQLEHEAADVGIWEKLRQHLTPMDHDVAGIPEYCTATAAMAEQSNAAETVIASLAPTDNPHHLGRLGGHEITGVVGVGGMGVVLKAIDTSLDRIVAIKVMAPHLANNAAARRRFSREAKAAAAVLHPNVIPIHCVSSDQPIPHLVMAYIRGGSMQKRLDREGPLPTVEILRIGSQVAAGLAAAHEQGLVHRDIKPENILLEEGVERVTLTDFGLARAVDDVSVTREGMIAGTPQYMSPEQARGESVNQQSDLFSLGSVLYAVCTGRAPFRAESTYGVMRRIIDDEPTPIRELNPEIPPWLSEIIERLMAKEKSDRFGSAEEVHTLLEACLNHVQHPTVDELPEPLRRTCTKQPPPDRPRQGWLATGLALFALLFAGIVYYIQTDQGTVRVEVMDESLSVIIEGQIVTMRETGKQPITLRAGRHKLVVQQGATELITDNFEIERNRKIVFKVSLQEGNLVVFKDGKRTSSIASPAHVAEGPARLAESKHEVKEGIENPGTPPVLYKGVPLDVRFERPPLEAFTPEAREALQKGARYQDRVSNIAFNHRSWVDPSDVMDPTMLVRKKSAPASVQQVLHVATPEGIQFEDADIRISDDQSLVLVGKNGERLLRIDSSQRTATAERVSGWRHMQFLPGSRHLAIKTWDHVLIRDLDQPLRAVPKMPHSMSEGDWINPAVSPDGKTVVTRPRQTHIQFWDSATHKPKGAPDAANGHVDRMHFTSDSKHLCVYTEVGLCLWDPTTGSLKAGPFPDGPFPIGLIGQTAYDPVVQRIATIDNNDHSQPVDLESRVLVRSIRSTDRTSDQAITVPAHSRRVFWSDPKHLIAWGARKASPEDIDGYFYKTYPLFLITMDVDAPKPIEIAKHIYTLELTPDGRHMIGASDTETLCWRVGQSKPLWRIPGRAKEIRPTNECVLLRGFQRTLRLHSVTTGGVLQNWDNKWRKELATQVHGDRIWLFDEDEIQVWASRHPSGRQHQ